MAQFTKRTPVVREQGVVTTASQTPDRLTHQGGAGFTRDAKSELFLTAVTHLHGKGTFYEDADARATRLRTLIEQVAHDDPDWLAHFIPWLRDEAGIRTAAVVAAVEYARAGAPDARAVVARTFQRADEPAEALAYFHSRYGRRVPKALKKGLADACVRLYDEQTILKYDSARHATRPADVIALCHPRPRDERQSAVFTMLADRRHGRTPYDETLALLPRVRADRDGDHATWERASSEGKVAWDDMIPKMKVMALLRNLRNFDNDGISDLSFERVRAKLTSREDVRASRVFPLRMLAAWTNVTSMRWGPVLEEALELSLANVPALRGRTLVLWDCSGSMRGGFFQRPSALAGSPERYQQAGVFALALAKRCEDAEVIAYSTSGVRVPTNGSVLRTVEKVADIDRLWGGTDTWGVLRGALAVDHDRVVIVTDEQTGAFGLPDLDRILGQRPCHILNVAGYEPASAPSGRVVTFGGFNDRAFTALAQVEAGLVQQWPWED